MAVVYDSALIYLRTATQLCDKITKIEGIITALEDAAVIAATGQDISEYSLDDGQSKIKTLYRSADAIYRSIRAFERLSQMYQNRLNGRVMHMVDGKSFRR